MNINTKEERQLARTKLDEIARAKIQEDFQVARQDLETFNPSDEDTTARGILFDAHQFLDQLDRLDRVPPVLESAPSTRKDARRITSPEFLIDKWMPANRLTILTGTGGIGKSYLALQHIAGLALGITDYFLKPYHGTVEELYSENSHALCAKTPSKSSSPPTKKI